MDKLHYEEYRDVFSVINKRTFNTFIKLYEGGPVRVKGFKNVKMIDELMKGGFVQKSYEDGELKYRTTVVGERIFEAVADVCDGVGFGSVIRYGSGDVDSE